jgi:Protein of unknown function (DUF1552)
MNRFSRRLVLRGAGVAIALPWLEYTLPKQAQAQAAGNNPKRYMPIFLPNGASENWKPASMGVGAAWTMSPVFDPTKGDGDIGAFTAALKAKLNVLSGFENGSAFNADGGSSVEPSHGRQPGAFLTCVDPGVIRKNMNVGEANAISLDQIMATHPAFKDKTALASLQLGLSTVLSYCDGQPCSNSRSISWSGATTPMYKQVDPLEVFNKIVGVIKPSTGMPTMPTGPDPEAVKRAARNKSVLDAVLENATRTQAKLGAADKMRLDEFLTSVRAIEKAATGVSAGMGGVACSASMKPTMATVHPDAPKQNTATYNKGTHALAMNDLIVMALQCDATRIITYMLEDERSEFTYDHVKMRTFNATGSTVGNGTCPEYHGGGQHGSQDAFASIVRWNTGVVADLATRLDASKEPDGTSILDNTILFYAGPMHGSDHSCHFLPVSLIGGSALGLKQDQHVDLGKRPLRDLHFTMMQKFFDMSDVKNFGQDLTGTQIKVVSEISA